MTARLGAVLCFVVLLSAGKVQAQSEEACMQAAPAEAIAVCQSLIDSGTAKAAVWVQLALSLSKQGRDGDANRILTDGIDRFPRDTDLLALRNRLGAETSEAARLEEAAQRNPSAMAKGELKLACRTRRGPIAIEACRRYLDMTDVDGDRVRTRLAELEEDNTPSVQALSEIATRQTPESQTEADSANAPLSPDSMITVITPEPSPPATEAASPAVLPPSADAVQQRQRVAAIQRALTALGLPTGIVDGIAGQKTQDALARFDERTGHRSGTSYSEGTLASLEAERRALARAQATLARSREAAEAARHDAAIELLGRARSESVFLDLPTAYLDELEQIRSKELARQREAEQDEAERQRAEAVMAPAISVDPAPRDETSSRLTSDEETRSALLVRIGVLQRQLADAEMSMQSEMARIRHEVQGVLGR